MDLLLHNLRTIGTHHYDQTVGEEAAQEIERLRAENNAIKLAAAEAAAMLREEAETLRMCSTVAGIWDATESETRAQYEQFIALADRLTQPMLPPNAEVSGRAA